MVDFPQVSPGKRIALKEIGRRSIAQKLIRLRHTEGSSIEHFVSSNVRLGEYTMTSTTKMDKHCLAD